MNVRRTILISVTVVALVGLLAAAAVALTGDGRGGPPWARGWHGGPWHGGGWHGDEGRGWRGGPDPERVRDLRSELAADLAGELGSSAEEVETAFRTVAERRLQVAAENGRIDEAAIGEALDAYDEGDVKALLQALWREPATTEPQ